MNSTLSLFLSIISRKRIWNYMIKIGDWMAVGVRVREEMRWWWVYE
ncbi:hypothetical protein ES332_A10G138500v1 [Gossypium tomentosum]|uniref:Uncharacterized protein n=1 Tax=Gossypium tomentosum TaxID=34277 RepID=A0A5D2NPQ9_GOSTO|nr:hypothetical protein ES332_A10G138500v1 [Gossypium tomentosum]